MSFVRLRRRDDDRSGRGEDAPDYAEPIVGWRLWSVDREALVLRSLFHPSIWPRRRPIVAVCERWRPLARITDRRHEPPSERCTCGVYAAALDTIADYLEDPPGMGVEAVPRVLGLVSLWGSVVECEHGWRASHAYPAAIYVPSFSSAAGDPAPEEIAAALAAYHVPVEIVAASRPEELIEGLERETLSISRLSSLGGA